MEKPTFKKICKMYIQQLTNFPYIEKDFDALTDYQLLCKIVDYLNKVIENQNTQNESIINLYNAFTELKDYIDNYFDNLDVQEEINNKLDEMARDGTLQEIVASYLETKAIFGFDNVASMKEATNLINGSYAKTLGYYEINDGGSSLYKIREITNEDIVDERFIIALNDNNLIAELIIINQEVNFMQLGLISETYTNEDITFNNLTINLLDKTLNYKSVNFNNCNIKNGIIISPTRYSIIFNKNTSLKNVSIINNNTTGDTANNMMTSHFQNENDNVIIENCTFKNYGIHLDECKFINIKNNLFYCTLDNSSSLTGGIEFIHVTNSSLVLENCIIEGNVFKDSKYDCIDIYPTGDNNVIKNNTFYRCRKGLELKAQNRAESETNRTVVPIRSCLIKGNYFREMVVGDDNECMTIFCGDDTGTDDYSKYPHIIIDSCVFCNDLGASYKAIRLRHINNIQISNCRTNKIDTTNDPSEYFVYAIDGSNAIINNCITTGELVYDSTENGIFYVNNCVGKIIRRVRKLILNNCQLTSLVLPNNISGLFYNLVNLYMTTGNFRYKGGLVSILNSKFDTIYNDFTEDSSSTNINSCLLTNCFYTGSIGTDNANFTSTNCIKMSGSVNNYINNLN